MIDNGRIPLAILILLVAGSFTTAAQFQNDYNYASGQDTLDRRYDSIMVDTMIRYYYQPVNDSFPDYKIYNNYNTEGQIIWQYEFDDSSRHIVRNDLSYDTDGNLLSKIRYIYSYDSLCPALDTIGWYLNDSIPEVGDCSMDDQDWVIDHRSIWEYDSRGNNTFHEEFTYTDGKGWKVQNNYNAKGQLISWISYVKQGTGESWTGDEKGECSYDKQGNKDSLITSQWQKWSNDWVTSKKEEWDYDEKGLLRSWTEFEWDSAEDKWIIEKYQQFYYDEHDKLLKYVHLDHDYWLEERWVMGHQYEYIEHHYYDKEEHYFNDKGIDTLRTWGRFFADITGFENWECEVRGHTVTDRNGYPVLQIEFKSYKKESSYDDSGVLLMEAEYKCEWDGQAWEWLGIVKWEYFYDKDSLRQIHTEYNWDEQDKSWFLVHKEFYYYSEYSVKIWPVGIPGPVREKQSCLVFPNPSDGFFRIELPDQADYFLDVYTTNGKKVYTSWIRNGKASFDLSNLDAGLYLLILTSEKSRYSNRIILK